jgi:electron transfer flavoprotein alpha subunit
MSLDLSYFEALLGGPVEEQSGAAGGIWVVSPAGAFDDGILRLVGKARVVADALGATVTLLLGTDSASDLNRARNAIAAGADRVLLATGVPTVADLADFFQSRAAQAILFPRTSLGRMLGPGLAQVLGGGLCGYAADLAVDPINQRIVAHQPILDDAARQAIGLLAVPAVVVVDTAALPAAFDEPWRTGDVTDAGVTWPAAVEYPRVPLPVAAASAPQADLGGATTVVAGGRGLRTAEGFALADRLAKALGGATAGDLAALDAGWITEEQLIGLTGHSIAPKLLVTLGMDGDTSLFMATQEAATIVAVQPDPLAAIVAVADYNVIADPAGFAEALLQALAEA